MSEIQNILSKLQGTREAEVLSQMIDSYGTISDKQKEWYEKSQFFCPDACGECCRNFEPDLLESEALYMAAWIIENKPDLAEEVREGRFPFPENKGCFFWDEKNPYHCTIYGGRPFICRLFGACGNRGKNGEIVFKTCKFYPAEKLAAWKIPLSHRQYSQQEVMEIFGNLPPVMSDLMEKAVSITPDDMKTELIHKILPDTIKRLFWIVSMNSQ